MYWSLTKKEGANLRATLCIFVISLLLRIWFNFFSCHHNAVFACDAAEYLRHAQNMLSVYNNLTTYYPQSLGACLKILFEQGSGNDINLISQIFLPLKAMSISGPAFPLFILISFKIFGQNPSLQSDAIPVLTQCVLSALTCVLIAKIASLCYNLQVGLLSGFIAAFYPGFIINSGRLYSESFACFLFCMGIWLFLNYLVRNKHNLLYGFLLGICLFALQGTRSTMSVLTLFVAFFFILSSLLVIEKQKIIIRYSLALLCGFLICLLPWLILQKLAFGKTSFIVNRVGQYNFFVGNDIDELGWLSIPYPDLTGVDKAEYTNLLKNSIKKSPQCFVKLLADKPARLLKLSWNDFRTSLGNVSCNVQTFFHQLILVFAFIGITTIFSSHYSPQKQKILARFIVLCLALFHLIYLFFITVPRYGLTAMPEIIIFAAAGLSIIYKSFMAKPHNKQTLKVIFATILLMSLSQLNLLSLFGHINDTARQIHFWLYINMILKSIVFYLFLLCCWKLAKQKNSTINYHIKLCIVLAILLAAPAYCLPIRANGRWYEWSKDFSNKNAQIERQITLQKKQIKNLENSPSFLALNIDGGSNLSSHWNIKINGNQLRGPFIPALSLAQNLALVHKDGINYSIEQEFILKCLCSINSLSLLDLRQWYLIPLEKDDLNLSTSNNQLLNIQIEKNTESPNTIYGNYKLSKNFSIIPSLFRFSWEKAFYGVEKAEDLGDPAYDQKIETSSAQNNGGPYIKVLIPSSSSQEISKENKVSISSLNQKKFISIYKEASTATSSNKELVLQFKAPKPSSPNVSKSNIYWLIRLSGVIQTKDRYGEKYDITENNRLKFLLWPSLVFSSNKEQANKNIQYNSPWLPSYLKFSPQSNKHSLHFDICFPILINAFDEKLKAIDLHLIENQAHKLQIESLLQIYQINKLPSETNYEIL